MESRQELEKRVERLEKELAAVRGTTYRGIRKRASWGLGNLPFFDIALGPDLARGELRGHARGVIAVGDIATGFLAVGGLARGVVALGGLALGLISVGGLSLGIVAGLGGLAIGGVALGGGAFGAVAMGGGAVGHYACGGAAVGTHVISPVHRDPAAEAFFRDFALGGLCAGRHQEKTWFERSGRL